jgi:hypothetical protein
MTVVTAGFKSKKIPLPNMILAIIPDEDPQFLTAVIQILRQFSFCTIFCLPGIKLSQNIHSKLTRYFLH